MNIITKDKIIPETIIKKNSDTVYILDPGTSDNGFTFTAFKKKPVYIFAMQLHQSMRRAKNKTIKINDRELTIYGTDPMPRMIHMASVETEEGKMYANAGDWIIIGVEGEIYPCKDSVFQKTYTSDYV